MTKKEWIEYVRYNLWAHQRMATMLQEIPEEDFNKNITNSFPSIRKTVQHISDAEFIWLDRLQGGTPTELPSIHSIGGQKEVIDTLINQSTVFLEEVQDKDDAYFAEVLQIKNTQGEINRYNRLQMIHHCMNHSSYHRGQVVTLARQVGITSFQSVDYIWYLRQQHEIEA